MEADGDGDQLIAVILDQPGLDALRADDPLDVDRMSKRRQKEGQDRREEKPLHGCASACSSPVTEVLICKTLRAAAMTSAGVTVAILSDQFCTSSRLKPTDSEMPMSRAGPMSPSRALMASACSRPLAAATSASLTPLARRSAISASILW